MKEKINTKINIIKKYYAENKTYFFVGVGVLAIILYFVFSGSSKLAITVFDVKKTDLKQTVLATGQVTSQTDLTLSFPVSGVISSLPVSVGDKVWKGQVLATLNNRREYATLSDAKANYQKVVDGNSNEEVAVAQASLDSAKASLDNTQKVQDTLLENAHRALLSVDLTPVLASGPVTTAPSVTGTYTGVTEGVYTITPYNTGSGGYFSWTGLETGSANISTTAPVALGTKGLFAQFPTNFSSNTGSVWTINLPNTKSANYLTAYNAYQNALKNHDSAISAAQAVVNEAKANLDLKKASAKPADVAVAQARVDQALADYQNTIIYAPANGTVVHVDTKVGENVDPKKETIVLQDVDNLYVEANVNETSIAKIVLHQPVKMTLDAFGPEVSFVGEVIHIDPSSTTADGIANYVIKSSIADSGTNKVRPGMNANMVITALDHPGVIAIPKVSIVAKDDGSYVNIVKGDKSDISESRKITTGMTGDGNLVEVLSGLAEGEKIAVGK